MTDTLFDHPAARSDDPSTSKDAASRMAPAAPALEARILEALSFRSLTDTAICEVLDVDPRKWGSVKTARSRLKNRGKVAWTGEVRNHQRVWCLPQNCTPHPVTVRGDVL